MEKNKSQISVYRILDAALNRGSEGLRVVEDYLRMVVADAHLSKQVKELRHRLTLSTSGLDQQKLIAARDSQGDVGRDIETQSEYERDSALSLVQANMARAQQAIRTIEEFTKAISPEVAQQVEQLRYDSYSIEKAILTTVLSMETLADAKLYVLANCGRSLDDFSHRIQHLLEANVDLIQLREKRLNDRELLMAGKRLTEMTRGRKTRWIMNDRVDLAYACNADGVHLGQDDLPIADARRILGATRLIGVSTHTIQQARRAVLEGANYIGVGPVFPSQTKSFAEFPGLAFVQEVAREIQLPAFAIGGIDLDNVDQVVAAGVNRIAVRNAIVKAENPMVAATHFLNRLEN